MKREELRFLQCLTIFCEKEWKKTNQSLQRRLSVMTSTDWVEKNVVKNHQFTPNCSPDVYLLSSLLPPRTYIFFVDFLFAYLKLPRHRSRIRTSQGDFTVYHKVNVVLFALFQLWESNDRSESDFWCWVGLDKSLDTECICQSDVLCLCQNCSKSPDTSKNTNFNHFIQFDKGLRYMDILNNG